MEGLKSFGVGDKIAAVHKQAEAWFDTQVNAENLLAVA